MHNDPSGDDGLPSGPMFARGQSDRKTVELRGMVDHKLIDIFDAVSLARGKNRIDLVVEVMEKAAAQWVHEASLIHRVTRSNPPLSESSGGSSV